MKRSGIKTGAKSIERGSTFDKARSELKRRTTSECPVCGDVFDAFDRRRNRMRRTCGSRACVDEMIRRAKTGDANPMKRVEVRDRVSATRRANRAQVDTDLRPTDHRVCNRPGCPNVLLRPSQAYCSPRCHYTDRHRRGGSRRRDQPYHRCRHCSAVFAWNGRGRGVYCSLDCARASGITTKLQAEVVEVVRLRGNRRRDWNAFELGRCARPDCGRRAVHRHHVVFEQHVVAAGGDRWDPRNAIGLCLDCHANLHARLDFPVAALPAAALEFAFALLGPAARDYMSRRYTGDDPRLEHTYPEGAV